MSAQYYDLEVSRGSGNRPIKAKGRKDGPYRTGGIMHQDAIATTVPWYRALNREQWQVLFMSNLGWLFDGFEIYALFLTVGVCAASAARNCAIGRLAALCRHRAGHHRLRLGNGRRSRRDHRRLHRPQADDDAGNPGLFLDYRVERHRLELAVFCDIALSGRRRHRLGMGDWHVASFRIVARQRSRQGWRAVAIRRWDRELSRLRGLATDRRVGAQRLAIYVLGRDPAGPSCAVAPARHARIGALGGGE
jgi:hypothetical protein